ncbi:threonine synthase [Prolixibacter sp. NT017]|uniref:threonine synthase n=1 Tax=Prolixibacter sp. NT017 TaxID=2652390 RepID=UPI001275D16D|nr:threonine synthase [Prolixibacter sp. NT017]GET24107.1 threonine synthase [Prolixibacter sp. NT017]
MEYYSTEKKAPKVNLRTAVTEGLAPDRGLYMPERIVPLPAWFFKEMESFTFREIAFEVAKRFFGEDIPEADLQEIVFDTLSFDAPLVHVRDSIYSLELFHGPTLAFKDVGARFMARLLGYFLAKQNGRVNVLVATSGDTGSAVANGFFNVPGIHVYVLYPKGKVSEIQEKQFTTLGHNITALEIDGTFDDCQRLVKSAFMDDELKKQLTLTSANSINVARFLPQAFYYFNAWARLPEKDKKVVFSVPSGNFGNLTAGLFAKRMGLPVHRFIAANNRNDVVFEYLKTGEFKPRPSVATIANAMDVGDPSNFARILDLYQDDVEAIRKDISGTRYTDEEIRETLGRIYKETGYLLDPHGATGYQALEDNLQPDEAGIFLETAHPAKFTETVEGVIGKGNVPMPERLENFLRNERVIDSLGASFETFKAFLLEHAE